MNTLPFQQQIRIVGLLVEGNSIRGIERLVGNHRDSIMRLGRRIGEDCHRLHHHRMQNLQPALIQADEMWSFVNSKQRNITEHSPPEHGDTYTVAGAGRGPQSDHRLPCRQAADAGRCRLLP